MNELWLQANTKSSKKPYEKQLIEEAQQAEQEAQEEVRLRGRVLRIAHEGNIPKVA